MATNPPITIGELTNVPAPGSGVTSAWSQDVTARITHRFANIAARDAAFPAPPDGTVAYTAADKVWWFRTGGVWVSVSPTPWIAPAMLNSWVPVAAGYLLPGYRMVGDMVQVRGHVKSGTAGAAVFTLPAGYLPPATLLVAASNNGVPGVITVAGGDVRPSATSVNFGLNFEFSVTP